ncbi:helix-turn-helix transcriptional regulator [Rubinisphaera brasiliensis]|nr:AraC family transcriptional regulator [Rubinisphaera brasiliensis]
MTLDSNRPRNTPVPENVLGSGIWVFESAHDTTFTMSATRHSFPKLLYFREGRGHLEFSQAGGPKPLPCQAGDCVIVPAHTDHFIKDAPGEPLSLYGLAMDPRKIPACGELSDLLPSGSLPRQRVVLLDVESRLRRLLYLTAQDSPIANLRAVAAAIELMAVIAQSRTAETNDKAASRLNACPEIDEYLRWLSTSFFEPVTLDDAADACGFSRRKFTDQFKRRTGMTWLNYLHTLRVRHAVSLLKETNSPVTSIAFQCGFDDLSTFYRVFKRIAGQQPRDIRQAEIPDASTQRD